MELGKVFAAGLLALGPVLAQTFPPDYRTEDATVVSRIQYLFSRMADHHNELANEYQRLIALPANRVYRQLDAQARVAALQAALPLVKQVAMSEAVQKAHDEQMARQYGAVDHGLKLPHRVDPRQRFEAMSRQMSKNPAIMQKPGFMQEFMKVRQEVEAAAAEEVYDQMLTLFTKPPADLKRQFQSDRQGSEQNPSAKKCYDEAAPLVDSDLERFRLAAYRCSLIVFGVDKSEAEADRIRKERAQRLYDERGSKGVIRKILTEFLETAPTVDFTAQTATKGVRQVFVSPEYEKKNGLWKLIYRNGKEPTEVAVQFARAWLAELQPPAPAAVPATASAPKASPAKAAPKK